MRPGPGKPAWEPTQEHREQAEALSGFGMTHDEIAGILGVATITMQAHLGPELRMGAAKADSKVLTNLFKMATGSGPEAGKCAIFWTKVRRRWHEVQRVIHGYDPEIVTSFVKQVVGLLRRELPEKCPHCKTNLDLPKRVAGQLLQLSQKLSDSLPPSEIVPREPERAESG